MKTRTGPFGLVHVLQRGHDEVVRQLDAGPVVRATGSQACVLSGTPAMRACTRQDCAMRRAEMFDTVEIVSSPETIGAGYAGKTGICYGFTTPSVTGVQVIGDEGDDRALNVGFDNGTSAWFHPSLIGFVDVNAGQVAMVGDKRFVRAPSGDWTEDPQPRGNLSNAAHRGPLASVLDWLSRLARGGRGAR
jgi:hypothetical protein